VAWVRATRLCGGCGVRVGGLSTSKADARPDPLRPTFLQRAPRCQPRHSGGGGWGWGVAAVPSYLPGRATAAPVIHSRAAASAVCAFTSITTYIIYQ